MIINILSNKQLKNLYNYTISQNLKILIKIHDHHKLKHTYKINTKLININNKNLKQFITNIKHTNTILKNKKPNHHYISKNNIHNTSNIKKILHNNINNLLINKTLIHYNNLSKFLPQLKIQKIKS